MAKRGKPRSRIPVRVGGLEATLEDFRKELLVEFGQKTALLVAEYDELKVAELREASATQAKRLEWLEMPLHMRALVRIERWWNGRLVPWLRRVASASKGPAVRCPTCGNVAMVLGLTDYECNNGHTWPRPPAAPAAPTTTGADAPNATPTARGAGSAQ